jgi:hypothetical protein
MKIDLKIAPLTGWILGAGAIITAVIMGLTLWGILNVDPSNLITGITLVVLGLVIFSEILREGRFNPMHIKGPSGIALFVATASIIFGGYISVYGFETLPPQMLGVVGFFYFVNAFVVGIELRKS